MARHELGNRLRSVETRTDSGATTRHKADLSAMADVLRGSMDVAEYKHFALDLIFCSYTLDALGERLAASLAEWGEEAVEIREECNVANIHWVPTDACWGYLKAKARPLQRNVKR